MWFQSILLLPGSWKPLLMVDNKAVLEVFIGLMLRGLGEKAMVTIAVPCHRYIVYVLLNLY